MYVCTCSITATVNKSIRIGATATAMRYAQCSYSFVFIFVRVPAIKALPNKTVRILVSYQHSNEIIPIDNHMIRL